MVVLNGAMGPLDEILVIALGFGIVWIALRIGGRKPKDADDTEEDRPEESEDDR